MAMPEGMDRATPFTTMEELHCLKTSWGISFVGRYYSQSAWKSLTRQEAELISSAGLYIVTVYQDANNTPAYFSAERGDEDCQRATRLAAAVGQPFGTPIYFAVDMEAAAGSDAMNRVLDYFRGVLRTMQQQTQAGGGHAWKLGVYGSHDTVAAVTAQVPGITHRWQTYAWSRGKVLPACELYQYENDVKQPCSGDPVDKVRSSGDGGGFRV